MKLTARSRAMIDRFLNWCIDQGPQPWWKFWHPMSGWRGGALAGIPVAIFVLLLLL